MWIKSYVMEVVDITMTLTEDVGAAVSTAHAAASARCEDADRANSARNEATGKSDVNSANVTETARDESLTAADGVDNMRGGSICTEDGADCADLSKSGSMEVDGNTDCADQSSKGGSSGSEGDCDSTSESIYLEAMTADGQDYYLRLGDTPRRRSALRLSRIIARRQLLRRLAQGRCGKVQMYFNEVFTLLGSSRVLERRS